MSNEVYDFNIGHSTAYAYAKASGDLPEGMTPEEYGELLASYATVGQTAVTAAQTATTKASEAATSATTATNKASEATTAAQTATTKAGEASTSASTATSAKDTAVSASQTATSKATEATTAAATATSAKTDAVAANTAAQSAKTAAQTAQTGAETAAASVQSSAAQIATNAEDISQLKSAIDECANDLNSVKNVLDISIEGYSMDMDFDPVLTNVHKEKIVGLDGNLVTENGYNVLEADIEEFHEYSVTGTGDPLFVILNDQNAVIDFKRATHTSDTIDYEFVAPRGSVKILINRHGNIPILSDKTKTYRFTKNGNVITPDGGNTFYVGTDEGFKTELMLNDPKYNGTFNFQSILYNQELFKDSVDDIAPFYTTAGYVGGNHGFEYLFRCVCPSNHGLSASDIGKTQVTDGYTWVLLRIVSETIFEVICYDSSRWTRIRKDQPVPSSFDFNGNVISGFTSSREQVYPAIKNHKQTHNIYEDRLIINETYDVYNIGEGIEYIMAHAGLCDNDTFIERASSAITLKAKYTIYDDGNVLINSSFKKLILGFTLYRFAGTQVIPFSVTDMIAAVGSSVDELTQGAVDFTKATWNDQNKAPQLFVKTSADKSKGFAVAFLNDRSSYLDDLAGYVSQTYIKLYPYMVQKTSGVQTNIAFNSSIIRMPLVRNVSGADYLAVVEANNAVYMFVGILTSRTEEIMLPNNCSGKTMSIVTASNATTNEGIAISSITVTSSGEGYLLLKFTN